MSWALPEIVHPSHSKNKKNTFKFKPISKPRLISRLIGNKPISIYALLAFDKTEIDDEVPASSSLREVSRFTMLSDDEISEPDLPDEIQVSPIRLFLDVVIPDRKCVLAECGNYEIRDFDFEIINKTLRPNFNAVPLNQAHIDAIDEFQKNVWATGGVESPNNLVRLAIDKYVSILKDEGFFDKFFPESMAKSEAASIVWRQIRNVATVGFGLTKNKYHRSTKISTILKDIDKNSEPIFDIDGQQLHPSKSLITMLSISFGVNLPADLLDDNPSLRDLAKKMVGYSSGNLQISL